MARLIRTSTIIEDCEAIVSDPQFMDSPVESYLVQHALVVFCAEIQEEIYAIVRARADLAEDKQLARFVSTVAKKVLRSVKKNELSGFVGHFGEDEQKRFNELLEDAEVTIYNNAVINRHKVAHRSGAQVTFSDLKKAVSAANNILNALESSIQVR